LGSSAKGKSAVLFGILGFVFNGNKINTSGGGAIVTRNEELKERALFLRLNPETTLLITNTVKLGIIIE
jgi:dTDP-4-amino-4,6-dideoxygalactose transaminase